MNRLLGMTVLSGMAGCMALLPSVAEANGGGYTRGSAYGDILPFDMEEIGHVAMLEEDLQINLWTTYADVKVTYKMKNTQNRPVKVRFGFPIEAEVSPFESSKEKRLQSMSPRTYRVTARGQEVPSSQVRQASVPGSGEYETMEAIESWMVSELEFAPGEELTLSIDCRVNHLVRVSYISDESNAHREMVYRLSSAAVWNGPIRKGKVTVRPRSVEADEVSIAAPANRFKREGDAWVWSFEDLEPTLADDIRIAVEPLEEKRRSVVTNQEDHFERNADLRNFVVRRGTVWMRGMSPVEIDVKASSTSKPLPAAKGEDAPCGFESGSLPVESMNWDTRYTWGEGVPGPGIGESVTVTLKKPSRLAGFRIVPCYVDHYGACMKYAWPEEAGNVARDSSEFNSVTEMEVVVNGGSWRKIVTFEPGLQEGAWVSLLLCKEKVKTVQLIIRKVAPGTVHDITCLSRLMMYRLLSKEPKIDPTR